MTDDDEKQTAAARGKVTRRPSGMPSRAAPKRARGLRIRRGDAENATSVDVALDEERRTVIGRHDAADIAFDAPEVSRLHGALSFENDRWWYQDVGSSNGSALERLGNLAVLAPLEKTPLEVGDVVIIGTDTCRIEVLADAGSSPSKAAAPRKSAATTALDDALATAARTPLPVFLLGPSGAGKTHAARVIHQESGVRGAFVAVNCARLPSEATALQSELLGHVKGAFTGAVGDRVGKLAAADGGTLFLDEVESLPEVAQGFLLDVLEGQGHAPLGAQGRDKGERSRFRLVSASKRPLAQSGLRADLCERLAEGHMIKLPTLDERRSDLPALVKSFADEQSRMLGVDVTVADDAMAALSSASWPGQIRQLRGAIVTCAHIAVGRISRESGARDVLQGIRLERVGALLGGARPSITSVTITAADVDKHLADRAAAFDAAGAAGAGAVGAGAIAAGVKPNPRHLTAVDIKAVLERHHGNQSAAARELGIARNTLLRKMKDFDIAGDA